MPWQYLIMVPIMAWGITYLMTQEDGPFNIFLSIRQFDFCPQHKYEDFEDFKKCVEKNTTGVVNKVRNAFVGYIKGIFDCMYCASPYATALVVALVILQGDVKLDYNAVLLWGYSFSVSIGINILWDKIEDV